MGEELAVLSTGHSPRIAIICDSQDLTFHTVLSDWVATVRQDPWQRVLSVNACLRQLSHPLLITSGLSVIQVQPHTDHVYKPTRATVCQRAPHRAGKRLRQWDPILAREQILYHRSGLIALCPADLVVQPKFRSVPVPLHCGWRYVQDLRGLLN